jgi:curli production assembly/transport component CsgG|tara:strand:+ start:606 stop:1520 length:915 start_codon:yes stop_codon:yes gene_type:complete
MKTTLIVTLILLMSSCASIVPLNGIGDENCLKMVECVESPIIVELPTHQKLLNLPPATEKPIIAVYKFLDKTGQRKQKGDAAMFSTAVSQGSETMLIDALKTAGDGNWFRVVERVGIDHLTRERQIVRSTREAYADETKLAPMLFAGIILEGGIIGYDTNIETGGRGARYLGVGTQQAYRRDIVTVHLRAVSVLTGEILLNVQTSKTILSVAQGYDVFRFVELDTQLVEIEDGMTENESVTRSVRSTIEAAVYELILQGDERGFWTIQWPVNDEMIKDEVREIMEEVEIIVIEDEEKEIKRKNK